MKNLKNQNSSFKQKVDEESNVSVSIVLLTTDRKRLNALYQFNSQNKSRQAVELLDTWYSADLYPGNKVSESLCVLEEEDFMNEVSNENQRLFKECKVIGTPTFFVNGYLLPNQYDIGDIKYFS